MSCCDDHRRSIQNERRLVPERTATRLSKPIKFVYLGRGRLTVIGPLTGLEYNFSGGGPALQVHPWDAASLAEVPRLTIAAGLRSAPSRP